MRPKVTALIFTSPRPCAPTTTEPAAVAVHWAVGGALPAVFQRETELPLCGAEMRGGHGYGPPRDPGFHKQGRQAQSLGHRGAGPILAKKGNSPGCARPEGRGNALV